MSYECKILADSVSPEGVRLTTLQATFPRFILAELNTHRMLSRNSASSRAIPPEKQILRVMEEPFVPETFNMRVKGMGVGAELASEDQIASAAHWLNARNEAVKAAQGLLRLNVDKSRINRLLEPFMWHTAIVSATEWENFFALRCHPDAQPEFQIIANMMRDAMSRSVPRHLPYGEWHLPLVNLDFPENDSPEPDWEYWAMVSAGRCARVSFDTHEGYEMPGKSKERAERLMTSGHLSPFEHCARPLHPDYDYSSWYPGQSYMAEFHPGDEFFVGNFRGWIQMRKMITNEENFALVEASA